MGKPAFFSYSISLKPNKHEVIYLMLVLVSEPVQSTYLLHALIAGIESRLKVAGSSPTTIFPYTVL